MKNSELDTQLANYAQVIDNFHVALTADFEQPECAGLAVEATIGCQRAWRSGDEP